MKKYIFLLFFTCTNLLTFYGLDVDVKLTPKTAEELENTAIRAAQHLSVKGIPVLLHLPSFKAGLISCYGLFLASLGTYALYKNFTEKSEEIESFKAKIQEFFIKKVPFSAMTAVGVYLLLNSENFV